MMEEVIQNHERGKVGHRKPDGGGKENTERHQTKIIEYLTDPHKQETCCTVGLSKD
jgi:hypothetical protein